MDFIKFRPFSTTMQYTRSLGKVKKDDGDEAGIRAVDLAILREQKFVTPDAFVILANAFEELIEMNKLKYKIDYILRHVTKNSPQSYVNAYTSVRKTIKEATEIPEFKQELKEMFDGLTAKGIGLEQGDAPLRIILSPNIPLDPENNDSIIQNIRGWEEFQIAVQEAWALAYHPTQLKPRMTAGFSENKLKIAMIVQLMDEPTTCCHAYSTLPVARDKLFLQTYYGHLDLRNKITKDYYALAKDGLDILTTEVREQPEILEVNDDGELAVVPLSSKTEHDKVIDRVVQELARQTKKAERVLNEPVKCFFANKDERHTLLWVNRLGFELRKPAETPEPQAEPAPEETPEAPSEKTEAPEEPETPPEKAEEPAKTEQPEPPQESPEDEQSLEHQMQLAVAAVEEKFKEVFPDSKMDRLSRMIKRLNEKNAWSRQVDGSLLAQGNRAVHEEGFDLEIEDLKKIEDEIRFLTS